MWIGPLRWAPRRDLSKVAPAQELISAIHAVLEGEALLPPVNISRGNEHSTTT